MSIAEEFPDAGLVENMTTGSLTIQSATSGITINHNLGVRPDAIVFWGDFESIESIPYGCCVKVLLGRWPLVSGRNQTENAMQFLYIYSHPTSGNLLTGVYTSSPTAFTDTTAVIARGNQDWVPNDANGNPITYKWCAIRFKDT